MHRPALIAVYSLLLLATFGSAALCWSPPVALNTGSLTTNYLWQAQIAPAASGGVHAVFWASSVPRYVRFQDSAFGSIRTLPDGWGPSVTEGGDGSIRVTLNRNSVGYPGSDVILETSTNGGASFTESCVWQAPNLGPSNRESNDLPLIISAGTPGSSELICSTLREQQYMVGTPPNEYWSGYGSTVYARDFDGTSWGSYTGLPNGSIGSWTSPSYQKGTLFRSLQDRNVYRVFGQYTGSDFQICAYRWTGSGWSARDILFGGLSFPSSISMAISPNGYKMVTYLTGDPATLKCRLYTPGAGWGPETVVANPSNAGKVAAIPGTDDFIIAYWKGWTGSSQVYVRRYSNGFLAEQSVVPSAAVTHVFADLAVAESGEVYIAYVKSLGSDTWQFNVVYEGSMAEPRGTLAGRVSDQFGAGIAGVLVQSGAYATLTSASGDYSLSISEGTKSVTASKQYYTPQTVSNIVITAGQTTTQNFTITATPPGPVTSLTASSSDKTVSLSWTNPSSANFVGTRVVYKTSGFPATPFDGTAICQKTNAPGTTDSYQHSGLTNGVTYYYAAYAYDSDGHFSSATHATGSPKPLNCGDVRRLPMGSVLNLNGVVVTGIFAADGCIYVEDEGRVGGIRVANSGAGLALGDRVNITGATLSTYKPDGSTPSEALLSGTVTKASSGTPLEPIGVNCRSIGGGALPNGVPGVKNGVGPNNIGLLVRFAGKVTQVIGSYIYVDDGTLVADISGRVGVLVQCPSTPSVVVGNVVIVTGVIRGSIPVGWTTNRRYVCLRSIGDLRLVASSKGVFSGVVRNGASLAVAGAAVATGSGGYSTTTDSYGAYTIANVDPGTYTLTASKTGYNSDTRSGVVAAAYAVTTTDFTINTIPGAISGVVTMSGGQALSGATVATDTGGYSTVTASNGSYTLSGVAPGTYSVTASKSGYISSTNTPVSVSQGATTTSNFTLTPVSVEKVVNSDMEGGFFPTGWGTTCSLLVSALPAPSGTWGWNNVSGTPFNTFDAADVVHTGGHSLGFAFCSTAASPGMIGVAAQSVNLGSAGASATFSVWAYHTDGNCPSVMCWNPGAGQINPSSAYSGGRYQWVTTDNWAQRNVWVNRTMAVTADSSGYVTVMVGGAAHTGTASGAKLYIDDVSVK